MNILYFSLYSLRGFVDAFFFVCVFVSSCILSDVE